MARGGAPKRERADEMKSESEALRHLRQQKRSELQDQLSKKQTTTGSGFGSSLPPELKARVEAKMKKLRTEPTGLQREKLDAISNRREPFDDAWEKKARLPTPRGLQREKLHALPNVDYPRD